jgi:hypothetical protein
VVLITDQREPTTENVHDAFTAPDRATVDAFHAAVLEAGGTDNGAPGIREIYHPTYYAANVLDPDGTTSRSSAVGLSSRLPVRGQPSGDTGVHWELGFQLASAKREHAPEPAV